MNVFKTFEQRMNSVFGAAPQGFTAPISLRKLARRATREMEAETFVVDGVNTAPALYTILVSSADDATMRMLYPQFTAELSDLVEQEGKRRNYSFVGKPLARFMVDPSLRSGRFAVFAENVDGRTLNRLRLEEEAFLSGASTLGGAASSAPQSAAIMHGHKGRRRASRKAAIATPSAMTLPETPSARDDELSLSSAADAAPSVVPTPIAAPVPVRVATAPVGARAGVAGANAAASAAAASAAAAQGASRVPSIASEHLRAIPVPDPVAIPVSGSPLTDDSIGLGVIPTDFVDSQYADAFSSALDAVPDMAIPDVVAGAPASSLPEVPEVSAQSLQVPVTQRRPQAQPAPAATSYAAQDRQAPAMQAQPAASFTLIDHQSGRSYTASAPVSVLGRERGENAVVLRDPNVSRRHAQISFDGQTWRIKDLHSTNGTLVNDIDITEAALHDGDLITVGLMNLEFREN